MLSKPSLDGPSKNYSELTSSLPSTHSEAYAPIHPPNTLQQYLPADKHLGPVDMSNVVEEIKVISAEEEARLVRVANRPPIDECLSLYDFEAVAKSVLPTAAWAYYSSGADDVRHTFFYASRSFPLSRPLYVFLLLLNIL